MQHYNNNDFDMYLSNIKDHEVLDSDIQIQLVKKAQQGDNEAREKLIMSNLRFVIQYAKRFKKLGIAFNELVSEGNLGLIFAIDRYNLDLNIKFISYASWWIRHFILKCVYQSRSIVRLPQNKIRLLQDAIKEQKYLEMHRNKSSKEIAETLEDTFNMSFDQLQYLFNSALDVFSLNNEINSEEGHTTYLDTLISENEDSIDDIVEEKNHIELIKSYMSQLNTREQEIVARRFGLDGVTPATLQKLSQDIGITKERVRQIEMRALQKIRKIHETSKTPMELLVA